MKKNVKQSFTLILAACALAAQIRADEPAKNLAAPLGLYVQNGVLLKGGKAYRGVGANYFSLFSRLLENPDDTSGFTNLAALAQARIPFVRFMCSGFWPINHQLYLTDRSAYFSRLDQVVRCAEANGIGLIPSFFWNSSSVPDLMGEPMDELGNPRSKTIAFIRSYTEEVVKRYKDSPAIWGWEFGNEYNLGCDLPNAVEHRPPVWPTLGTATKRSGRDDPTFAQVRVALEAFSGTVRKFDGKRVIISGNSIPRGSAWHNTREKTWTTDSAEQFNEILLRDNPDPLDTICIHLYPDKGGYPAGTTSLQAVVALTQKLAVQAGKPLFIGEFGVTQEECTREQQQAVFAEMLGAIERERVPLAAFWVFDLYLQHNDWNVTFSNERAWMLDAIMQINSRLRNELK